MEDIDFLNSCESQEKNFDLLNIKSDFEDLNFQYDFDLFFKGLNNNKFQIPKFSCQLNNKLYKFQKKPHKNKITKEYIKDKNKENARRYRQRHKFIYSHIVKENEKLKFDVNKIMKYIENNLCPCCMKIITNSTKKEYFVIQKK